MVRQTLVLVSELTVVMFSVLEVSVCLEIMPPTSYVSFCGIEQNVTLPCMPTTSTNESLQIEWYYVNPRGEREKVMRVNTDGKMRVAENFSDRVVQAGGASLVLIKPTSKDAGRYECDVISSDEDPCCDTGSVNLTINEDGCAKAGANIDNDNTMYNKTPICRLENFINCLSDRTPVAQTRA